MRCAAVRQEQRRSSLTRLRSVVLVEFGRQPRHDGHFDEEDEEVNERLFVRVVVLAGYCWVGKRAARLEIVRASQHTTLPYRYRDCSAANILSPEVNTLDDEVLLAQAGIPSIGICSRRKSGRQMCLSEGRECAIVGGGRIVRNRQHCGAKGARAIRGLMDISDVDDDIVLVECI